MAAEDYFDPYDVGTGRELDDEWQSPYRRRQALTNNPAMRERINHAETCKSRSCKYCGVDGFHWHHDGVRWTLLDSSGRVHNCPHKHQLSHKDQSQMKSARQQNRDLHGDTNKDQTLTVSGNVVVSIQAMKTPAEAIASLMAKKTEPHVNRAEQTKVIPDRYEFKDSQKPVLGFVMNGLAHCGNFDRALAMRPGDAVVLAMVKNPVDPLAIGCFVQHETGNFEINGKQFLQVGWVPRSLGHGQEALYNLLNGGLDLRAVMFRNASKTAGNPQIVIWAYFEV